jgi:thymidylate synthase (FAD)
MAKAVEPKVFLLGYTVAHRQGLEDYLKYTNQTDFLESWQAGRAAGLSEGEILCSMYAKLCYKSLVLGKNANVTRIRDVKENLEGCFNQAHGSVFEHVMINFVVTDCSRVLTHELVRHRIGTAFSQTSGRYCRGENVDIVLDPILATVQKAMMQTLSHLESDYKFWCSLMGLNGKESLRIAMYSGILNWPDDQELAAAMEKLGMAADGSMPMDQRKKVTSALRRMLPNGQADEIGFSANIRALRHMTAVRTNRHAEWEIRLVFNQVYDLVREKFPMIFYKARTREINGLREVYGMKHQPYEMDAADPAALEFYDSIALATELDKRTAEAMAKKDQD